MNFWVIISNLGDVASMTPVTAGIAIFLMYRRAWRLAIWWLALFMFSSFLVLVSKAAFIGWGIGHQGLDFTGLSGHATRAMAIFPVIGYLMAKNYPESTYLKRYLPLILFTLLGTIISVSRYLLFFHSWSEIIAGWLLGASVSGCFIVLLRQYKHLSLTAEMRLIALIPLLFISNIEPTPTQLWIVNFSLYLSGHEQPYDRKHWRLSTMDTAHGIAATYEPSYAKGAYTRVPDDKKISSLTNNENNFK